MKQLVAAETNFTIFDGPHARPLDRHLLAHDDAKAPLLTPAVRLSVGLSLAAFARQRANFLFHYEPDDLQAGLADELAHPLPQAAEHLGHRQYHLHRRAAIGGHLLEPFHGALRFNLVWFLHS